MTGEDDMNDEIIKVLKEARTVVSNILGDACMSVKRIPRLLNNIEKLLNKLEKDDE
jgi:ribosome-binding factor A